jgi:hypothetical protein
MLKKFGRKRRQVSKKLILITFFSYFRRNIFKIKFGKYETQIKLIFFAYFDLLSLRHNLIFIFSLTIKQFIF